MFKFGTRSLEKLNTCHEDLQLIIHESLKYSPVDFGITEGHRSIEKQQEYYNRGLSKIDGITKKGKHNYFPSLACDIYIYIPNKPNLSYSKELLSLVSGIIQTTAKRLLEAGKITHVIRWGGDWNSNGDISDQTFIDMPHFELISIKLNKDE